MDKISPAEPAAPCCCHSEHFTDRELDVLCEVAAGLTNDQVASSMNISSHTVAGHLRTMLGRSNARTRVELIARSYAAGILAANVWPPHRSGRRCLQLPISNGQPLGHGLAVLG